MATKPSVGRIVHYVSYGTPGGEYKSECRAAIVTDVVKPSVVKDTVSLCVLNPGGVFFDLTVLPSQKDHTGGTWHWPEREPEVATN
jgi:hypothetical protein